MSSLEQLSGLTAQLVNRLALPEEGKRSASVVAVASSEPIPSPPDWAAGLSDRAWPILYAARLDEAVLPLMTPAQVEQLGLPVGDVIRLTLIMERLRRRNE